MVVLSSNPGKGCYVDGKLSGNCINSFSHMAINNHEPSIGVVCILLISPKSEPALDLHTRAAPSVEAHYHVNGPDTGRNSGGRRIVEKIK